MGIPGQGNNDPLAIFPDHALVRFNGLIYDPSYGKGGGGKYKDIIEWEDDAISGYGVLFLDNRPTRSSSRLWFGALDKKGIQEVDSN